MPLPLRQIDMYNTQGDISNTMAEILKFIGRSLNTHLIPWKCVPLKLQENVWHPYYVIAVREAYDIVIMDQPSQWQFAVIPRGQKNLTDAVTSPFTVDATTEQQLAKLMDTFITILGKPIPMDAVIASVDRTGNPLLDRAMSLVRHPFSRHGT